MNCSSLMRLTLDSSTWRMHFGGQQARIRGLRSPIQIEQVFLDSNSFPLGHVPEPAGQPTPSGEKIEASALRVGDFQLLFRPPGKKPKKNNISSSHRFSLKPTGEISKHKILSKWKATLTGVRFWLALAAKHLRKGQAPKAASLCVCEGVSVHCKALCGNQDWAN